MNATSKQLVHCLTALGASEYPVTGGRAHTKKVARFALPNARPIAVEHGVATPNIWLDAELAEPFERRGLSVEIYQPGRPRNSNLMQVREFRQTRVAKIVVHDVAAAAEALATLVQAVRPVP
jgi:hypothetical protein